MIRLTSFQAWQWRNRFAEHPVGVAQIEIDGDWRAEALGPEAFAALAQAFADVDADLLLQPPGGLLAAVCLSMQRRKYAVPPLAGLTEGGFWFAAADPVYASVSAGGAVAFVSGLAARQAFTPAEVAANRRAESARLRAFERIDATSSAA